MIRTNTSPWTALFSAEGRDTAVPPADLAPGDGASAPGAAPRPGPATEGEIAFGDSTDARPETQTGAGTQVPPKGSEQDPAAPPQDGGSTMMIVMVGLFALMYVFLILPQKKKEKERKKMIEAMKKGDKVVSIGGIIGVVSSVEKDQITVRTGDSTKLTFTRSAISRIVDKEEEKK